jgi:hypothetical protein
MSDNICIYCYTTKTIIKIKNETVVILGIFRAVPPVQSTARYRLKMCDDFDVAWHIF